MTGAPFDAVYFLWHIFRLRYRSKIRSLVHMIRHPFSEHGVPYDFGWRVHGWYGIPENGILDADEQKFQRKYSF